MKQIFSNLWNGPAATVAGALTMGLTYAATHDDVLPDWAVMTIGIVAAVLSFIAGPQKPKA